MNTAIQHNTKSNFNDVSSVVTVDSHVPAAGGIVWWRLSGTVDYNALRAAWLAAGLREDDLISPCSPTVAMTRAVRELSEKRRLVRPLGRDAGFAIVKERVVDSAKALDHDVLCKFTLDKIGVVQVEQVHALAHETKAMLDEVRAAFDRALDALDTSDFSAWLSRMMPRLDAVGLREGGGVYFVPHTRMSQLETVVQVIRANSSHAINRVPAMRTEDAVEAILDAITQEATEEAEHMERDIEAAKLGSRAFENRLDHCDTVESKVTRYEALLGCKLDTIRERLETLRAQLSVAILKAQRTEKGESLANI